MSSKMEEWLILHENENRLSFFAFGFILFFLWGYFFPFRQTEEFDRLRYVNNILLAGINVVIANLCLPISLVAFALKCKTHHIGLFHHITLPASINILLSILILDVWIYAQHLIFHRSSFLWRFHRVHHSDIGFDTTTALRFHPVEIFISWAIKLLAIGVFGIHASSVILFEIILNFSAMFNHSNFSLHPTIETFLSAIFVTPDIHRIHHSELARETHSNFGFFLSIWDTIFSTKIKQSERNLKVMNIGLPYFRSLKDQALEQLLIQPNKEGKFS